MTTNPFIDIFLNTRLTTREVIENNYSRFMNLLFCLNGIVWMFSWIQKTPRYDDKNLLPVIMATLTLGAILGLIVSRLTAVSIYWTGKLLDGKSTYKEILRTTAYASVPNIGLLFIIICKFLFFVKEPISSVRPEMVDNPLIVACLSILEGVLAIWMLVIFIKTVSETQKLTIGRTIVNLLLAFMIVGPANYFGIIRWL